MSTRGRFQRSATRLIRRLGDGGTVTLRRRHTLKSQRKGTSAVSGVLLVVDGAHLAGVSTISLRADLLTGRFPKGCKFTIAGNATEYTLTNSPEASTSGVLSAVGIDPVLAANAGDGAAVTITTPYADYSFVRTRGSVRADVLVANEQQTAQLLHLATRADGIEPEPGDHVLEGGAERRIAAVRTVNPGLGPTRHVLALGAAAA